MGRRREKPTSTRHHDLVNVSGEEITTLARLETGRGELVLRRAGDRFEIISNGVFLMDTSDGTSERLLVTAAVAACPAREPRILIGGLGVGFSLRRAADLDHVRAIDVVEIEPAIIGWHQTFLSHLTGVALADRRVSVHECDLVTWLRGHTDPYDVICVDTDNGPNWLVFDANRDLYAAAGLDLLASRLSDGGVLAIWSAARDLDFERRLRRRFGDFEMLESPVRRGSPDIVYLARRRGPTV
jgi:spermidine synthase